MAILARPLEARERRREAVGVELLGVLITVVLIDGLWRRREAATTASLDATLGRLEARRHKILTEEERAAWRQFAHDYHELHRDGSPVTRLRHPAAYRRRLLDLQRRADQTLATYD